MRCTILRSFLAVFFWSLTTIAQTEVGQARPVLGPMVMKSFDETFFTHGFAADALVLFVVEAGFVPQVRVLNRLTMREIGSLPQPAGGMQTPLNIRIRNVRQLSPTESQGELIVLDSFTPDATGKQTSFLYEYSYRFSLLGGFSATLSALHPLPMNSSPANVLPNGLVYPLSFDLLPGGDVVVVDMVALWVSDDSLENWRMALVSPNFNMGPYCTTVAIDGLEVPGEWMSVRDENYRKAVVPYQWRGPAPLLPGLKGVTYVPPVDRIVFVKTATPGGIFWIHRDSLLDATVPPFAKPFEALVAPELGLSDLAGDVAFDVYHPNSEWVYWQRTASEPGQNHCENAHPLSEKFFPIYRVNIRTAEVQFVAESWMLYDFSSVLNVLPPPFPNSPFTMLVSSNVQEERLAVTNALRDDYWLVTPTLVPVVFVDSRSSGSRRNEHSVWSAAYLH